MGGYLCNRCGKGRHKDNDGFNTVQEWKNKLAGRVKPEAVVCDECLSAMLEENEIGEVELALVNGEPLFPPEPPDLLPRSKDD